MFEKLSPPLRLLKMMLVSQDIRRQVYRLQIQHTIVNVTNPTFTSLFLTGLPILLLVTKWTRLEAQRGEYETLQGCGEVAIADNAINAHRKFSPLDNMGIK